MKKLLSIVLALVLVLGSLPVFADGYATQPTAGETLKHYGFIKGYEDGTIRPENHLTREQLAALLAEIHGKGEEAKVFAAPSGFADEAKFPNWSKPYIAFAQSQGWLKGDTQGVFNNKGAVTTEMLATVLLRALGQDEKWGENTANWNKLVGEKANMMAPESKRLTRGEAFNMIWPTVSLPVMKDEKVLGVVIGKLEELKPVVKELMVESVKADNLKEIVVTFNHEVKKDSLAKAFALKPNAPGAISAELKEDNKTVVLTVTNPLVNQKKYVLTANNVVAAEDENVKLAKTETEFTAFDATLPMVENVEFTGPRNVTITFSEPVVRNAGKLSVKQEKTVLSVNNAARTEDARKINVPLYSTLSDGKTYTLEITGYKDLAGYENINKTLELTYTKDTTAPTANVVKAEQTYLIVEFSKPVTGVTADKFAHTFSAYKAVAVKSEDGKTNYTATDVVQKARVVFYQVAADKALPEGDVKVMIMGDKIKDLWGNKLGDVEMVVKVAADKVAPEVKEIKVLAEDQVRIIFTKGVKEVVKGKQLEILGSDGKAVAGLYYTVTKKSDSEYDVKFGKKQAGKTFIFNITGVKDTTLSENKMADYSTTVTIGDETAPVVKKAVLEDAGVNYNEKTPPVVPATFYVFFDEPVDSSALEAANYIVKELKGGNTVYTKLSNAAEFHNGDMVVKFTLSKDEYASLNSAGAKLVVENVKDTAGNKILPIDNVITKGLSAATQPEVKSVVAQSLDKVVITFSEEVDGIEKTDFTFNPAIPAADLATVSMEVEVVANKTVVTLTQTDETKDLLAYTDATNVAIQTTVEVPVNMVTSTAFQTGNKAHPAAAPTDKIKPAVKKDGIKFIKATGKFEIDTTRNMDAANANMYAHDFVLVLDGTKLTPVIDYTTAVAGAKITISLTTVKEGNYNLTLVDSPVFATAQNNPLAKFDAFVADLNKTTTFTIKEGATNDAANLTIVFSEPLYKGGAEADGAITASFNKTGTVTITSATLTKATREVVFVLGGPAAANDTLVLVENDAANTLTNVGGNPVKPATLKYNGTNWVLE
ncbi:MAG: Ig-like domain-containing protein [Bacillota bacterium]|nr:Ig-like domain-containing protein [Bacillota bacterium]